MDVPIDTQHTIDIVQERCSSANSLLSASSFEPDDLTNADEVQSSTQSVIFRRLGELIRFTFDRPHELTLRRLLTRRSSPPVVVSKTTTPLISANTRLCPGTVPSCFTDDDDFVVGRDGTSSLLECQLCLSDFSRANMTTLQSSCQHTFCTKCLEQMLTLAILEGKSVIECPMVDCNEHIHPSDITRIVNFSERLLLKYERFMVRRVLQTIPDCRWCPAPDCPYAVIASGCASCPRLVCELCNTEFCYHCQEIWHPNQTCRQARYGGGRGSGGGRKMCNLGRGACGTGRRSPQVFISRRRHHIRRDSNGRLHDTIKRCPCCKVAIMKVDDGSCNHITCSQCGSEFCWLCLKIISDFHFLSPSGCTFWGQRPWSRKKKFLFRLLALLGAPIGISLAACVTVPAIFIGLPIWAGRKVHRKLAFAHRPKRNLAVFIASFSALLAAPVITALVIAIGVPVMFTYTYAVIPISMCKGDDYVDGSVNDEFWLEDNRVPFSRHPTAVLPEVASQPPAAMAGDPQRPKRRPAEIWDISLNIYHSFASSLDANNLPMKSTISCNNACGSAVEVLSSL